MRGRRASLDDARMGFVVLALCCECGNLRARSPRSGRRNGTCAGMEPDEIAKARPFNPAYWDTVVPFERWLEDLKCAACGRVTRHARVWPEGHLDEAEERNASMPARCG